MQDSKRKTYEKPAIAKQAVLSRVTAKVTRVGNGDNGGNGFQILP